MEAKLLAKDVVLRHVGGQQRPHCPFCFPVGYRYDRGSSLFVLGLQLPAKQRRITAPAASARAWAKAIHSGLTTLLPTSSVFSPSIGKDFPRLCVLADC